LARGLKQDVFLEAAVSEDNKVLIDSQYVGELKGLKFIIDFNSKNLDVDLKSIKKAARRGVEKELSKRAKRIIVEKQLTIESEDKIIWLNNPIARIRKGENYLCPEIEIIADEALPLEIRKELEQFLKNWTTSYINKVLGDLINLTNIKVENQYLRALSFQLYESNGILKRINVDEIIKLISKDERKKLWGMGIKIGRYHIFLPKMLKPKAVTLRTMLWKVYNNVSSNIDIPKFGLNFLINKNLNESFLLLCGFERFDSYYVRVDILEKLFITIIEKTVAQNFKITPEMMNLLGCTKENFYKLMLLMNYKKSKEADCYYFAGKNKPYNRKILKKNNKTNPFSKLLALNIK